MVPIGLKHQFLAKLHESHMGVVKSKLLARTLIYWPNWNNDIEHVCAVNVKYAERTNTCLQIFPKFQVNARGLGEVCGCDMSQKYKAGNTL